MRATCVVDEIVLVCTTTGVEVVVPIKAPFLVVVSNIGVDAVIVVVVSTCVVVSTFVVVSIFVVVVG